jgi:iron-sulfur cluster assembly protein
VGVKGGGCAGMEFLLDFTDTTTDADYLYNSEGVEIVVDEISATYLVGTEIDYVDGLTDNGFKFNNLAKRSCGCGKSFGV